MHSRGDLDAEDFNLMTDRSVLRDSKIGNMIRKSYL